MFFHHAARVLALAGLVFLSACSQPKEYGTGNVRVSDPWARATSGDVGAGYMRIANRGDVPAKLVGGTTPLAQTVEIHMMSMEGGVMRMRAMGEGLEVPAHGDVVLAPGGLHVMLIGLKQPLAAGEKVPLTLSFDGGTTVAVELEVREVGAGDHGH